jgi:hypothetical protein
MSALTRNYFDTLAETREEIARRLTDAKAVLRDPEFFSDCFKSFRSGVLPGETVRACAPLWEYRGHPTRKHATAVIFRMESGKYELTFYVL